jgi:DNA-binding GntR family transcriptional regulator
MASRNGTSSKSHNGTSAPKKVAESGLLKQRAYIAIKQRILGGDFPPSTFLSERQMAAELAMSKTPIRAAVERLEFEGFVRISPQHGIIVRDVSVTDIADQYEIRTALETYVVRTLAGRLTAAQTEQLQANLRDQKLQCSAVAVQRWVELDASFHLLFCEFLGNQEILRAMGQLREKIHRITSQVFQLHPGRVAASYVEHCGIADAVVKGDPRLASQLMEEHLDRGKRCLLSPRDGV